MLLAFGHSPLRREEISAVILFHSQGLHLVQCVLSVLPAVQADVDLRDRKPHTTLVVEARPVEQAFGRCQAIIGMPLIGHLARQHQLQIPILWIGSRRLFATSKDLSNSCALRYVSTSS